MSFEGSQEEIVFGSQTQSQVVVGNFGEQLSMTEESTCRPTTTSELPLQKRGQRILQKRQRQSQSQRQRLYSVEADDSKDTSEGKTHKENFTSLAAFLDQTNQANVGDCAQGEQKKSPTSDQRFIPFDPPCTLLIHSTQNSFPSKDHDCEEEVDPREIAIPTVTSCQISPCAYHPCTPSSTSLLDIAIRRTNTRKKKYIHSEFPVLSRLSALDSLISCNPYSVNCESEMSINLANTNKSISNVMSRPTHWGQGAARGLAKSTTNSCKMQDTKIRARKLSEATKSSVLTATQTQQQKRKSLPMTTGGTLTFAPAFLGLPKPAGDVFSNNELDKEPLSGSPIFSFPRPKTNKQRIQQAGPLLQTLRKILSGIDGDVVRIQSGIYPPDVKDRNDPRQRSTSSMTISIVGPLVPWYDEKKMTSLAHVIHATCCEVSKHVNVILANAMARMLVPGSQLTIYNPIVIPGDPCIVVGTQLWELVVINDPRSTAI